MKKNSFYLFVVLLILSCQAEKQPPTNAAGMTGTERAKPDINRFKKEIDRFLESDQQAPREKGQVLFIGSSSIRMWDSLAVDMAPLEVINRGFGGSTLPEVIHYADQILFPYAPSTIVLYCGENDISEGASPLRVFRSFKTLIQEIRQKLPETMLYYIPMKPSIARWNLWPDYQKGNEMIATFIAAHEKMEYLDTSPTMLVDSISIDSSIFIEDGLHMNRAGYERWRDVVRAALITEEAQ
ncbi:MAG: GDSL-type esterase/lipase family protein [Bacteroidota bacterium]